MYYTYLLFRYSGLVRRQQERPAAILQSAVVKLGDTQMPLFRLICQCSGWAMCSPSKISRYANQS